MHFSHDPQEKTGHTRHPVCGPEQHPLNWDQEGSKAKINTEEKKFLKPFGILRCTDVLKILLLLEHIRIIIVWLCWNVYKIIGQ